MKRIITARMDSILNSITPAYNYSDTIINPIKSKLLYDLWEGKIDKIYKQSIKTSKKISVKEITDTTRCSIIYEHFSTEEMDEEAEHTYVLSDFETTYLFIREAIETVSITVCTSKKSIHKWALSIKKNAEDETVISLLRTDSGSLYIATHPIQTKPFIRSNYTETIAAGFDYICRGIKDPNPPGRLIILNGPAGSGKTYFIRGLIDKLRETKFIYIPSKMIGNLDGPELVSTLLDNSSHKTTVLIIEDGDGALYGSDTEQRSPTLSTLLNIGDGLIGAALNVKVIITANSPSTQFDPAVKRPGRLMKHLEIKALPIEKANEVYQRLSETEEAPYSKEKTLSEIYQDVRGPSNNPIEEEERKFGFHQ